MQRPSHRMFGKPTLFFDLGIQPNFALQTGPADPIALELSDELTAEDHRLSRRASTGLHRNSTTRVFSGAPVAVDLQNGSFITHDVLDKYPHHTERWKRRSVR